MDIPDLSLFMMCKSVNRSAFRDLPKGFYVRKCRESELGIWKAIHFDDDATAKEYDDFMTEFFDDVYARRADLFFSKCMFVCNHEDQPIGTCFIWRAYDKINTVHWFKVVKEYEGLGIGRALLTLVLKDLEDDDYPIYLHTHPSSFRAIKLYSDFGFQLLTDPMIGNRKNDIEEALPLLEKAMPHEDYRKLQMTEAPDDFLDVVRSAVVHEF